MPSLHAIIDTGGFARYIRAVMRGELKPGVVDEHGRTALHVACMQNNRTLAKYLLLRRDTDADARDADGKTALQLTPPDGLADMTMLFSQMEARRQSRRRHWRRKATKDSSQQQQQHSNNSNDDDNDASDSDSDSDRRRREEGMLSEGDVRESETVSPGTLRRIVLCLVAPFCFLVVYNGFCFAVKFIAVSLTFYYLSLAYFVAEVAIRPPWYHHKPQATQLTMVGCPDYWQGWICDPKVDFDLDFEDVSFRSTDGYTLRGWYVPAATATTAATRNDDDSQHAATSTQRPPPPSQPSSASYRDVSHSHYRYYSREASRVVNSSSHASQHTHNSRSVSSSGGGGGAGAAASPRPVGLVLVHGGGRDRRTWLRHLPFLHEAGYACLLFDLREHGCSDGHMRGFTFGMRERYDVIAACQFMRRVSGCARVCAMGTSVGGASVIMAAAIDKTIDLVIAENAITTSASLLDQQVVLYFGGYFAKHPYSLFFFKLFRRLCTFWLNVRIGNKPSRHCQALHCIDQIAPRPVLLMHGTIDTIVPCKHSQLLYERAKEPKELYLCEGAYHCGLYNTQPEVFEDTVLGFLRRYGGGEDDDEDEKKADDDDEKDNSSSNSGSALQHHHHNDTAAALSSSSSSAAVAADVKASAPLSHASRGSASWRRATRSQQSRSATQGGAATTVASDNNSNATTSTKAHAE